MQLQIASIPYTVIPVTVMAAPPAIPDGDSVRLRAENRDMWPSGVRFSRSNGSVQIRAEGIDALELHFFGRHQPLRWAEKARDFLLNSLGVDQPDRDHPKAWALTRSVDTYGRPITFVVPGSVKLEAGAQLAIGSSDLRDAVIDSVNCQLLSAGLVYPLFYENLPVEILTLLREIAKEAQESSQGLWPEDKSESGMVIRNTAEVSDKVIVPKLFRRILRYYGQGRQIKGLGGLRHFLNQEPDLLYLIQNDDLNTRVESSLGDKRVLFIDARKDSFHFRVSQQDILWREKGINPILPNDGETSESGVIKI